MLEITSADFAPSGAFPRLIGRLAFYTDKQLQDFAHQTRPSPVMSPIAKALSEQDMQDVADAPVDVMRDIAVRLKHDDIAALAAYFAQVRPPDRPGAPRQFP